ncbi:MAG: type II secretion system protein GspC [Myxococcota bacterium]|nr:type II secretion system protein GspC [Myxococcota bacterium]
MFRTEVFRLMFGLQNKVLIGMFATSTVLALAATVAVNVVPPMIWPLSEDVELIDPFGLESSSAAVGDASEAPRVSAQSKSTQRPSKRTLVDPIIRRNMFDSSKVGVEATPDADGEAGNKTSLPVVLLATIVADPEAYSSCLIAEDKGEEGALGYGVGDSVLGEATIFRIEQKRVILKRSDGTLEYLEMDGAKAAPARSSGAKAAKAGKWDGVKKDGETKFTIDQETFDKILENPDKLAGQIRAVPHTDDSGKVDGYRLSGIRRSSLFRKLGIKNGDVVHSVNGNDLTSMTSALSAFESLQNERNFSFEVTSRKKKKTYEYEVR